MKIGVLGAGSVGKTLGAAWSKTGHEIKFGVRAPAERSNEGSSDEISAWADIVVLAVPWGAVPEVLRNPLLFTGKIVIDCTNPINFEFTGLSISGEDSGGETVARTIPQAKVVKAFNTCGYNVMANPLFGATPAGMFVASNDNAAKQTVIRLAEEIGFDSIDAGPLTQSRYLEAAAWLWISIALKYGAGREIAFALLRR